MGARQTGKTTLIKSIIAQLPEKTLWLNGDDPANKALLDEQSLASLINLVGNNKIVIIDEGQRVPSIGQTVKLLVDHFGKEKQFIITGSSSLNLLDATHEPLTGRKFVYTLYPLSLKEILPEYKPELGPANTNPTILDMLTFGSYPEVTTLAGREAKIRRLRELASSYLYRDILEMQSVKSPILLEKLLRALALQIGSEVSYNELASLLGIDRLTVERYIDLLEKSFVIFRLPPFVRDKRKELAKMNKIYFYDIGIRNAIIDAFNLPGERVDTGAIWENYLMVERLKLVNYAEILPPRLYFWRTLNGTEIDLVEDWGGKISGYEFKWSKSTGQSAPPSWGEEFRVVSGRDVPGEFLYGRS